MNDQKNENKIKTIIREAVDAAIQAGRAQGLSTTKDAYRATERRLYALPVLIDKVQQDQAKLQALADGSGQERSKSIVRYTRTGFRADPEEIIEAVQVDLRAGIAADTYEIEIIQGVLRTIRDDPYYDAVFEKYVLSKSDEEIAEKIPCDPVTVWRNRKRLVQKLAIRLYGVAAV